jgi:hypothetical protein
MMDQRGKVMPLLVATAIMWIGVLVVWVALDLDVVRAAAAILALFFTMVIWSMWAMNEYGIDMDGTSHEKIKRDTGGHEDARLGLLFSLLTPDERDALKSRLVEDLSADGESVSLADLLAEAEADEPFTGHAS